LKKCGNENEERKSGAREELCIGITNPPESLFHDIEEILKLLGSIQKTMKHKNRNS